MQPFEIEQVLNQYQLHNEKLVLLSEQLQNIWLGILMLLGDPDQTRSAAAKMGQSRRLELGSSLQHLHGGGGASSSNSSYFLGHSMHSMAQSSSSSMAGGPRAGGRGMFRLRKDKRFGLALKVALLVCVGGGMILMAIFLNTRS